MFCEMNAGSLNRAIRLSPESHLHAFVAIANLFILLNRWTSTTSDEFRSLAGF